MMRLIVLKTLFITAFLVSTVEANLTNNTNDNLVLDTKTRLMWQDDNILSYQWGDAINYCENLSLEGYDDWRLPNILELRTIIDNSRNYPANYRIFNTGYSDIFWSSTSDSSVSGYSWTVDFSVGKSNTDVNTNVRYVRCVRGGSN